MRMDTVSLAVLRIEYDSLDSFNWAKIDEALTKPTFANLQRVEITILLEADSAPCDILIKSIVDRLPECHSKGILLVNGKFRRSVLR
jgi:hypothetical protein